MRRCVFATPDAPARLPGYSVAIWKHDHVAVTDLEAVKATGYWNEVMRAARAIRTLFGPAKVNYLTLGNAVPHLHTHILPRYLGDPAPGRPLPWELVEAALPMPEAELQRQAHELADSSKGNDPVGRADRPTRAVAGRRSAIPVLGSGRRRTPIQDSSASTASR